ncbi:MAG: hypothetical protein II842_00680 [Butyrivibrio sp.]|nr:hypothetical protein [Butyrivibrio sp.]
MAATTIERYAKPNMTNLPPDLGQEIFDQILSTPAPNRKKMKEESDALLKKMIKERDNEDA